MKVIFEMRDGTPYLSAITEDHYQSCYKTLPKKRVTLKDLEEECSLEHYGYNFCVIIDGTEFLKD